MAMVKDVSDRELVGEISQAPGLLLVDFWAPWCGPCRRVSPMLEDVAQAMAGQLRVVKVNVDRNQAWAQRLGVSAIPTLVLFREGQLVGRIDGVPSPQHLVRLIQQNL